MWGQSQIPRNCVESARFHLRGCSIVWDLPTPFSPLVVGVFGKWFGKGRLPHCWVTTTWMSAPPPKGQKTVSPSRGCHASPSPEPAFSTCTIMCDVKQTNRTNLGTPHAQQNHCETAETICRPIPHAQHAATCWETFGNSETILKITIRPNFWQFVQFCEHSMTTMKTSMKRWNSVGSNPTSHQWKLGQPHNATICVLWKRTCPFHVWCWERTERSLHSATLHVQARTPKNEVVLCATLLFFCLATAETTLHPCWSVLQQKMVTGWQVCAESSLRFTGVRSSDESSGAHWDQRLPMHVQAVSSRELIGTKAVGKPPAGQVCRHWACAPDIGNVCRIDGWRQDVWVQVVLGTSWSKWSFGKRVP